MGGLETADVVGYHVLRSVRFPSLPFPAHPNLIGHTFSDFYPLDS